MEEFMCSMDSSIFTSFIEMNDLLKGKKKLMRNFIDVWYAFREKFWRQKK